MILITIVERSDSTLERKMVMYVYYIFIIVTLQKLLRERPFRDCCTPGLMMMIFFDDDNDEKMMMMVMIFLSLPPLTPSLPHTYII